jgi:hypothetical protein
MQHEETAKTAKDTDTTKDTNTEAIASQSQWMTWARRILAGVISLVFGVKNYFPDNSDVVDAARASSLAGIPDKPARSSGVALGETTPARMIAASENDGTQTTEPYLPS